MIIITSSSSSSSSSSSISMLLLLSFSVARLGRVASDLDLANNNDNNE